MAYIRINGKECYQNAGREKRKMKIKNEILHIKFNFL
jgi:hypothetical protein